MSDSLWCSPWKAGLLHSVDGGTSWTFPDLPSDLESVGRIQLAAESERHDGA